MHTNGHNVTSMLRLHVRPNAARSEVTGLVNGVLQVKIAAPPVKGKANQELLALLSRVLDVSKNSVSITRGHTSRNKVITIDNLHQDEVMQRITPKLPPAA